MTATLTREEARTIAVRAQLLNGRAPRDPVALIGALGCVQLDPVRVVARSHELVLWSRLGAFDRTKIDRLQFRDRRLYEGWAHEASIVPTEDWPLQAAAQRAVARSTTSGYGQWAREHGSLQRRVLARLRTDGPLRARDIGGLRRRGSRTIGWGNEHDVELMLHHLSRVGRVAVTDRDGTTRRWDLTDRWLPAWTPRERLTDRQLTERAAERAVRALGHANAREITAHFLRRRYTDLPAALRRLERRGVLARVEVDGMRGERFLHRDADATLLDGRVALLSPFDNLICDRARTEALFEFAYKSEMYVPKAARRFGPYTMPILRGNRFVGRADLRSDREAGVLVVEQMYAERRGGLDGETAEAIGERVRDLAGFLGLESGVRVARGTLPRGWSAVRSAVG